MEMADDGDGRGVMSGEVADGIEEDQVREVRKLACHFMRLSAEVGWPWGEWRVDFHGGFSPLT